jgi:hypothetical protein
MIFFCITNDIFRDGELHVIQRIQISAPEVYSTVYILDLNRHVVEPSRIPPPPRDSSEL